MNLYVSSFKRGQTVFSIKFSGDNFRSKVNKWATRLWSVGMMEMEGYKRAVIRVMSNDY